MLSLILFVSYHSRLLLGGKESSTVTLFRHSVPNTVFRKIFENQVNNDSYNDDAGVARQRLISTPGTAYWAEVASVGASDEFLNCKVILNKLLFNFGKFSTFSYRLIKYGRLPTDTILLP